ncbi:TPA: hypothetical protein N0F65_000213 [Lagenidium giganteum]|uniref:Uncharacterized protein n=1 Tax=Lagenidium giganteum TaxID=4803 RepID=A0AAV2YI72_9STRA|nr:TPA: hypothetical protein N0F65_000213 [Lagenidium giganteum]
MPRGPRLSEDERRVIDNAQAAEMS